MKKVVALFIGLGMFSTGTLFAQELTQKEQKAIIKSLTAKLKGMDASEAQDMFDNYPSMKTKVSDLESEVSSLESEVSSKDSEISNLNSKVSSLEDSLSNMSAPAMTSSRDDMGDTDTGESSTARTSSSNSGSTARSTGKVVPGLVYKIQIGAFRNKDLTKYFDNNPNFGGDVDADGTKKYTIGVFAEYWEADTFKKYMRSMGVKDAWIVPYYNGKRVSMKDAREGVFN